LVKLFPYTSIEVYEIEGVKKEKSRENSDLAPNEKRAVCVMTSPSTVCCVRWWSVTVYG